MPSTTSPALNANASRNTQTPAIAIPMAAGAQGPAEPRRGIAQPATADCARKLSIVRREALAQRAPRPRSRSSSRRAAHVQVALRLAVRPRRVPDGLALVADERRRSSRPGRGSWSRVPVADVDRVGGVVAARRPAAARARRRRRRGTRASARRCPRARPRGSPLSTAVDVLVDHRGDHVRVLEVEVVVGAVEVGDHRRARSRTRTGAGRRRRARAASSWRARRARSTPPGSRSRCRPRRTGPA